MLCAESAVDYLSHSARVKQDVSLLFVCLFVCLSFAARGPACGYFMLELIPICCYYQNVQTSCRPQCGLEGVNKVFISNSSAHCPLIYDSYIMTELSRNHLSSFFHLRSFFSCDF